MGQGDDGPRQHSRLLFAHSTQALIHELENGKTLVNYPSPQDAPPVAHSRSAASWPAIIAGAFVAAAVSLVLFALGSGLGFAAVSPWPRSGISGMSLAVTAAIWLIVTQWLSAAVGGYIAGRLRTRWIGTHTHEVFFRDTAHGLITWAVATIFVAAVFATSAFSSAGAAGHAASEMAQAGMAPAGRGMGPAPMGLPPSGISPADSYEIDRLLRPANAGGSAQPGPDLKPEVSRIIANAALAGGMPDGDRAYLAQVVAARTGVSQPEAQKRVDDFVSSVQNAATKAKEAADIARKAAAQAAIYLALSLLVGAFIASVSAAIGGHLRDEHP
jgi:hypothetical protein